MKIRLGREINHSQRERARALFGEAIKAQRWDLWLTITFRNYTSQETALKKLKTLLKYLNRNQHNIVFVRNKTRSLVFFEKNSNRPGVHIHALIDGVNPDFADKLQKKCYQAFGDSKVEAYDTSRDAGIYLANKLFSSSLEHYENYTIHPRKSRKMDSLCLDESKNI